MNKQSILALGTLLIMIIAGSCELNAQNSRYKVSTPKSYKNLSIFLIHGRDQFERTNILTLEEAMENKLIKVYETSEVNELAVENVSKTHDVFIQSGDIVKGGKQDRVLAVSIIIPQNSGRILIQAFCVESGRWQKRGTESSEVFESSGDRVVSKELKLAAKPNGSQSDVWDNVSSAQKSLSSSVGESVNSNSSSTSLQLSLENKALKANIDQYLNRLQYAIDGETDVIGYAFAINGKINSADIYVSHSLFKKLWIKMLKAAATEAIANFDESSDYKSIIPQDVLSFIETAEKGKSKKETVSKGTMVVTREDDNNILFEAVDSTRNLVIHKSYLSKQ